MQFVALHESLIGTKKDSGDFERVAKGTFTWLGGTGKFNTIKGSGTYACTFTSKGGQCDWETEPEMQSQQF